MKYAKVEIIIASEDVNEREFLADAIWAINHGFRITQISDAMECLKYLQENPSPKIVFFDLEMSDKYGKDCLKDLKHICTQNKTQLIVYADSTDFNEIDLCYKMGVDSYIVKPHKFASLLNILSQVFATSFAKSKSLTKAKDAFVVRELKADDEWYQVECSADVY